MTCEHNQVNPHLASHCMKTFSIARYVSHLHVFLLHGLKIRRVLGQMSVGGTQVVDVACASLHAGSILHQVGLLAGRQSGRLEPQQLGDVFLQSDRPAGEDYAP